MIHYITLIIFTLLSFSYSSTAQTKNKTKSTFYSADNPYIQYSGRGDFTNPQRPVFSAPAVYIEAMFQGVSALVSLKDENLYDKYINTFSVIIDNKWVIRIKPSNTKKDTIFTIAKGLPFGEHSIRLIKRNESGTGKFTFSGFTFEGKILPPAPLPSKKIQVFGNSITCGAANIPGSCPQWEESIPLTDAYRSYAPVLARIFQADYQLTAVSGIGLVRNYGNGKDEKQLPSIYNLIHLNDITNSPKWNLQKFIPDLVVIELGTNDFSPGSEKRPDMDTLLYKKRYISFIDTLKKHWPAAQFLCLGSPLLGDNNPDPKYRPKAALSNTLKEVEQHYRLKNDTTVAYIPLTKTTELGCDQGHPSLKGHIDIARQVAPYITKKTGWQMTDGITHKDFKDPLQFLSWENKNVITATSSKNK